DPRSRPVLASSHSMKLRFLVPVALLCLSRVSRGAEPATDPAIARCPRELAAARAGFQDTPIDGLIGDAMIEAAGAEVALLPTVARGARLPAGPISRDDLMRLAPEDARLVTTTLTGADVRALLERAAAAFAAYDFLPDHALFAGGSGDSAIDQFQGLS